MKIKEETEKKSYVEKIKNKDGLVIKVRTYNYEPSKTQQHFKDEHDINNIMKKYLKQGISYNQLPNPSGVYGDFSNVKDYQNSLQTIIDADQAFLTIPSNIRKRFDNDPQKLFEFLNDKKNLDEAISLGLIEKPVKTETPPPKTETPPPKTETTKT